MLGSHTKKNHKSPGPVTIAADTLRDLVTLNVDLLTSARLGQLSYVAGRVIIPSTKFEDPMADLYKSLHVGRYPRRNPLCKFWLGSVKGFRGGE